MHNNYMWILKRIRRNWNLELDTFVFFKKDIALVKNCRCKLRMKIADRNCAWSALGLLDAGLSAHFQQVWNLFEATSSKNNVSTIFQKNFLWVTFFWSILLKYQLFDFHTIETQKVSMFWIISFILFKVVWNP